jgi:ribonucleoside-diphosphate reductase alpha chain
MLKNNPELVEDDMEKPSTQALFRFPLRSPAGAITREEETAIELLERVKSVYKEWVIPGHRRGENTHNVSVTVSVNDGEWDQVFSWMWRNRNNYAAIALMPTEVKYSQAPFIECSRYEYNKLRKSIKEVDLSNIIEDFDNTNHKEQIACSGGGCE